MNPPNYTSLPERFWSKVDEPDVNGCWNWIGGIGGDGYGTFRYEGPVVRAHRLAYMDRYGSILPGLFVLHHCDVRSCVKSEHLFEGTNAENMADMVSKDRQRPQRGELHGRSILTESTVSAIRQINVDSTHTYQQIANEFGVSRGTIIDVVTRRTWKGVIP